MRPRLRIVGVFGGLIAIGLLLGTSPNEYALDITCQPLSVLNRTRAVLQGSAFWQTQLRALHREQRKIEQFPALRLRASGAADSIRGSSQPVLDSFYRRFPQMRPSDAAEAARELRGAADEIESAERDRIIDSVMAARWLKLQSCEEFVTRQANL